MQRILKVDTPHVAFEARADVAPKQLPPFKWVRAVLGCTGTTGSLPVFFLTRYYAGVVDEGGYSMEIYPATFFELSSKVKGELIRWCSS